MPECARGRGSAAKAGLASSRLCCCSLQPRSSEADGCTRWQLLVVHQLAVYVARHAGRHNPARPALPLSAGRLRAACCMAPPLRPPAGTIRGWLAGWLAVEMDMGMPPSPVPHTECLIQDQILLRRMSNVIALCRP